MFNMFEDLFAPGRKHTNDERKRLELTRVDLNDGDPGRGPIDLTSGKVTVRLPDQPDRDTPAGEAEAATAPEAATGPEGDAGPEEGAGAEPATPPS